MYSVWIFESIYASFWLHPKNFIKHWHHWLLCRVLRLEVSSREAVVPDMMELMATPLPVQVWFVDPNVGSLLHTSHSLLSVQYLGVLHGDLVWGLTLYAFRCSCWDNFDEVVLVLTFCCSMTLVVRVLVLPVSPMYELLQTFLSASACIVNLVYNPTNLLLGSTQQLPDGVLQL